MRPLQFSLLVLCVCVALCAIVMGLTVGRTKPPLRYDGIDHQIELREETEYESWQP